MAHIVFDEVFQNGVLISRVQRTVTDYEELQQNAGPQLRAAYDTLRQWSQDAATVNTNWAAGATYTNTKDANLRETIRRIGILLDRFADLLIYLNADR